MESLLWGSMRRTSDSLPSSPVNLLKACHFGNQIEGLHPSLVETFFRGRVLCFPRQGALVNQLRGCLETLIRCSLGNRSSGPALDRLAVAAPICSPDSDRRRRSAPTLFVALDRVAVLRQDSFLCSFRSTQAISLTLGHLQPS